jgi:hypothetical protein
VRMAAVILLLGLGTVPRTERFLILAEHRIEMSLAARSRSPRTSEPAAAIPSSRPEEIYPEKNQWMLRELAVRPEPPAAPSAN